MTAAEVAWDEKKPSRVAHSMTDEQDHAPPEHDETAPLHASLHAPVHAPRRFRLRGCLLAALIAVVAIILFIILLDTVIMPLYVQRGSVATVPAVVGDLADTAVAVLHRAGYAPIEYETRLDDKVPKGTIIRETPESGEETKPGRKVYLIISGGKEMAVVPNLLGKSLRDAKMELIKENMSIGRVDYAYSDSATNGTIFLQSPGPNANVSASTLVSVTVSQGPLLGRVAVPDLKDISLSDAIAKLNGVGLAVGKVNYQNGEPEKPGARSISGFRGTRKSRRIRRSFRCTGRIAADKFAVSYTILLAATYTILSHALFGHRCPKPTILQLAGYGNMTNPSFWRWKPKPSSVAVWIHTRFGSIM